MEKVRSEGWARIPEVRKLNAGLRASMNTAEVVCARPRRNLLNPFGILIQIYNFVMNT